MSSQNPSGRGDRYDTSGNPETEYVDDQMLVLRNREGITDSESLMKREQELHAIAYELLLQETRIDTRLSCDLLKHIHSTIFLKLYEWAGRYRTVWISKPGITWPAPDFLVASMTAFESEILSKHSPELLAAEDAFCHAVAEIQGEFLVIHPFREGNARTIKLATDLLAIQTGRLPLAYDQSEQGAQAYIAAATAAFARDYALLEQVIHSALRR
jgi:cell filamentation protein